jgi:hypothetical protein
MIPGVKHPKLLDQIIRLLVVVLAINKVVHPLQAFTFLPSPKRVLSPPTTSHLRTLVPSTVRHGRGFRFILTSTLDVPEEEKQDNGLVVDNNAPPIETTWSQIESLQVTTLQSEMVGLGDVLMSSNGGGTVVLSCLSHYGDYNAWEMTQQYMSAIKSGRLSENW